MTSGLAIGVVLSMHTRATMERFGAAALIPAALAIAMISETGPLMTGLLVSGRVGAGIGAELGGMRVTEQIDALESLVDSFHYLAVTRIVACMIALPILTTVMNFSGLIGGFLAETGDEITQYARIVANRAAGLADSLMWLLLTPILAAFLLKDHSHFAEMFLQLIEGNQQRLFSDRC